MIRLVSPPWGWGNPRRPTGLSRGKTLVVVSPHSDDAVLSVGATLADASHSGIRVVNLTVFAGDPDSAAIPSDWDRRTGFSSAGAAARIRRREDAEACALIGMTPTWLPFPDDHYESDRANVWGAMENVLRTADLILVPGFPLVHPDHLWVSRVTYQHEDELPPIARYAEQPYAELEWVERRRVPEREASLVGSCDESASWARSSPSPSSWLRKNRALLRYSSQLRALASPPVRLLARTALYEFARGGEYIAVREHSMTGATSPQEYSVVGGEVDVR